MASSKIFRASEDAIRLDLGVAHEPYQRKTVSGRKRGRNKAFEDRVSEAAAGLGKTRRGGEVETTERIVDPILRIAMRRATLKQRNQRVRADRKAQSGKNKKKKNKKQQKEKESAVTIDIQSVPGAILLSEERQQAAQEYAERLDDQDLAQTFVEEVVAISQFEENLAAVIETVPTNTDINVLEDMMFEALETAALDITRPQDRMEIARAALTNTLETIMEEGEEEKETEADDMEGVTTEPNRPPAAMETEDVEAKRRERNAKIQRILQLMSKKYKGEKVAAVVKEEDEMNAFSDQFALIAHTGEGGFAGYKLSIEKILKQWDVLSPARCLFINNRLLREIEERGTILHKLESEGQPFVDELRMYEYVRDRQVEFLEQSRQMHPSLMGVRPETDDEFMERFQRLLTKHNKILQTTDFQSTTKNDAAALLLENQYMVERPRFEQLKTKMGEQFKQMDEYRRKLVAEPGAKDGFADIKTYELARKAYNTQHREMTKMYDSFRETFGTYEDDVLKDWNKLWKLSNKFVTEMTEAKPVETWLEISTTIRDEVNSAAERYSRDMQKLFNKDLKKIGDLLFQPYEAPKPGSPPESQYFIAYDDYKGLFNQYMALRKFFMKAAANNFDWKRADSKVRDGVANEIETMRRSMSNYHTKLRDPHKIEKELANRQELLSGILADQNKELRRAGRPRTEYQIHEQDILEKIDQSRKNIRAEWTADQLTYKLIFQNFPGSWTEAISGLESEVTELRRRVQTDISAFGPFLSYTISNIWARFSQKIQNVRPDEREQFMTAIEAEKDFLYKTISNESYRFNGSKLHKAATSGIDTLKDFVMNPESFTPKDKTRMINDTSIGLYMSNTRRLLGLIDQSMRLRQRMVSEPYRIMGMEGAKEAPKFDMVLTHLFPPSQVELKLRFLTQLPNRKRYEAGPFVKAIKMLFPDFDLDALNNETFISRVAEISQSSKEFLKNVVGMTPIAWSDFENQADELTRLEYEILSQVEDKPIENDPTRQQADQNFEPTDAPPYDRDAGAVMNDAGLRVNPTFNPVTQGQITRDAIDDAKRVSYIQIAGSLASVFLDPPDSTDPYVPLHVAPAKFFFSKDSYKTLSDQFDSMRPLQPKQTVDDPNGKIEEILSRYGKFLGIRKRATQRTDHPILVQQEAIELTEFVNAFKAYGQQTAGNYVHPVATDPTGNSNPASAQASGPSGPTSTSTSNDDNNVDPNDAGESTSDPLISGLRAAYQSAPRAPGGGGSNTENDGEGGAEDAALWGGWAPPS